MVIGRATPEEVGEADGEFAIVEDAVGLVLCGCGFLDEEEAGRSEDDGHDFGHRLFVVFSGSTKFFEVYLESFEVGGLGSFAAEGESGEFFDEFVGGGVVIEVGTIFPGGHSRVEEVFEAGAFFRIKGAFDFNPVDPDGGSGIGVLTGVLEFIDITARRVDVVIGEILADAHCELGCAQGLAGAENNRLWLFGSPGHS